MAATSNMTQSRNPDPTYAPAVEKTPTDYYGLLYDEFGRATGLTPQMAETVKRNLDAAIAREIDKRSSPTQREPKETDPRLREIAKAFMETTPKPVADFLEGAGNFLEGIYTYITGQPVDDDLRDEAAAVKAVGTALMAAGTAGAAAAAATGVGLPVAGALGGLTLLGWWLNDNVAGRLDMIQYQKDKEKKMLEEEQRYLERKRQEAEEWANRQAELERKRAEREAKSEEEFMRRMQEIERRRQEQLERLHAFYQELEEKRRKREEQTQAYYQERERLETATRNAFALAQNVRDLMDAAKNAVINKQPDIAFNLLSQADDTAAQLREYIERYKDDLIKAGVYDTYLQAWKTYQNIIDSQQGILLTRYPELWTGGKPQIPEERPRPKEEGEGKVTTRDIVRTVVVSRPREPTVTKPIQPSMQDIIQQIVKALLRELTANQAAGYRARTYLTAAPTIDVDDDTGLKLAQLFNKLKAKTWALGQLAGQVSRQIKGVSPYIIPDRKPLPTTTAAKFIQAILLKPPTPIEQMPYDLVIELWATHQFKLIAGRVYASLRQLGLTVEEIAKLTPKEQMALAMLRSIATFAARDGKITPVEYDLFQTAKDLLRLRTSRLEYLANELAAMQASPAPYGGEEAISSAEAM
jgi:hypothetical protein